MRTALLLIKKLFILLLIGVIFGSFTTVHAKETTLGDKWDALKTALSESESKNYFYASIKLEEAKRIYDENFKTAALEVDPQINERVERAFLQNSEYIKERSLFEASLNRQVIDKSIYTISYLKIEQALDNYNTEELFSWFSVLEKKFTISQKESLVTNKALEEIKESKDAINKHKKTVLKELLDIFKLKTIEELEETIAAVNQEKIDDAKKFTYEGLYYSKTLHYSITSKLGSEKAEMLESSMKNAIDVTMSGMPKEHIISKLKEILVDVQSILNEYDGNTSSISGILSDIKNRLSLIREEYTVSVADGKIIDQAEYDETVIFLNNALSTFNQTEDVLSKLSDTKTENLRTNLEKIKQIVESYGDPDELTDIISSSMSIIGEFTAESGPIEEITSLDYIAKIEQILNQVKIEYRNGNTQTALDLATLAYIDNYEFIEKDIAEEDIELMEQIERSLRIQLIQMIKDGAPADKVDSHVDEILQHLNSAKVIVPEFGPMAMIILVVSISAVFLYGQTKFKISKF